MSKKTPTIIRTPLLGNTFTTNYQSSPIVQNARRKLHYNSQLPIRCVAQRKNNQLYNSLKKFPLITASGCNNEKRHDKTCREKSKMQSNRKSASMIDLSARKRREIDSIIPESGCDGDNACVISRINDGKINDDDDDDEEYCDLAPWPSPLHKNATTCRQSNAAGLICRVLVINAWRRKRNENTELRLALTDFSKQIEHLQLQIVVLRKLLDKENVRVANLTGDLHRAKAQIEETIIERDQLKIEKESTESEAKKEHEILEEQSVTVENLRNELYNSRDQIDNLEKQLTREREKLLKLRDDKELLLKELSASEALAEERNTRIVKIESSLEDAQMQVTTQLAVTNSLQEEVQRCMNQIKEKEDEKINLNETIFNLEKKSTRLEERLRLSEEKEQTLSSRTEYLESQLINQAMSFRRVEADFNEQLLELKELREHFQRETQAGELSGRVLKLANNFIRTPGIIIRTLAFFTNVYF